MGKKMVRNYVQIHAGYRVDMLMTIIFSARRFGAGQLIVL